jgi:hypothetical protein
MGQSGGRRGGRDTAVCPVPLAGGVPAYLRAVVGNAGLAFKPETSRMSALPIRTIVLGA